MKKKYKRIIKGILIICLSFFLCLDANAEDDCPKESANKNITKYTVTVEDDFNGTITVKSKYDFKVLMLTGVPDSSGSTHFTYKEERDLKPNGTVTFNYTPKVKLAIKILYVYTGTDPCFKDGDKIIEVAKANGNYDMIENINAVYDSKDINVPGPINKENVPNRYYGDDKICGNFRNGVWNDKFNDYMLKADFEKYNPRVTNSQVEYRELFPYCYSSTVSRNLDEEYISNLAGIAIRSYKFRHRSLEESKPVEIPADSEQTFTDTSNLKLNLTCDILNIGTKSAEYQYVNKHKYTAIKETSKSYNTSKKTYTCKKTCTEVLTVEYGPPVASIAGLCFEYKVRVKSEVTCQTEGTDVPPPNPDDYKYCEPVVQCVSTSGRTIISYGGPNEDFDKCINKCDKGKYTQKCINKCYNKVYNTSNNSNLRLNYIDKVEATQLSDCNSILTQNQPDPTTLSNLIIDAPSTDRCYGHYEWVNGQIKWISGNGGHWTKYARYYFLNANETINTINQDSINMSAGNGRLMNGYERRYYSPIDGFKKWTHYTQGTYSGTAGCEYQCQYLGCSAGEKLNPDDVKGSFEDDMDVYEQFINECTAEASCSTKTAEFTIKVNNKTKDKPNEDNWINYDAATLRNTGSAVDIHDNSNIILNRSDCYGETINKNKYMTEWSFPGTWINNKTGEISYKEKEDKTWHKKKDKFCTSLNSADVNVGWWYYGTMNEKKNVVTGETMTDEQLKAAVTDYNIKASTSDFGHFSWKIDVSCFYALYDTAGKKECIDKNCDDIKDKNPAQRYRIRTVDTADLFPSPEGKDTTDATKTGRTPGFNWTINATNLKNEDYIIAPTALLEDIQTKERNGETYSDTNLEYEFVLDREALKAIRKHTTSGNYTNFTGKFEIVNGVSVYNSSLFRGLGSTLDSKYINKVGKLGCNNQENDSCNNYSSLTGIGG
ncbi:MAG: hypothetical protein MR846_02085 [Tenericutes bacterium]|nr:hypothetical protein [Mycoplasmatota bacterium]